MSRRPLLENLTTPMPWLLVIVAFFLLGACAEATIEDPDEETPIEGQPGQDNPGADVQGDPNADPSPGDGTDPMANGGKEPWEEPEIPEEFMEDPWQEDGTMADVLTDLQMAEIDIMREAIQVGLALGKQSYADELNRGLTGQLQEAYVYEGSFNLAPEVVAGVMEPKREVVCPFMLTPEEAQAEPVDCRVLTDRAKVSAYGQLTNIMSVNPLSDPKFDEKRADNDFWYEQGLMTGIDNETAVAVRHIRSLGLCDRAPEVPQSAYEEGVERGRLLYIVALNARLAETGNAMDYPNNVEVMNVCAVNNAMLTPARNRALGEIDPFLVAEPLCGNYEATNADEINRLNTARDRFADGMRRGVQTEHRRAGEVLFNVVPCNVGDPLVIDLEGDGVALKHVTEGVKFDLFDWGEPVQMGWINAEDAFLALDKNGNGVIDNGRELFVNFVGDSGYNEVATGFDNLALYDDPAKGGNNDGRIDRRDEQYAHLLVWRDANSDGTSQPSELKPLALSGIASISLGYRENLKAWPMPHRTRFVRDPAAALETGKITGHVHDAWFTHGHARPE